MSGNVQEASMQSKDCDNTTAYAGLLGVPRRPGLTRLASSVVIVFCALAAESRGATVRLWSSAVIVSDTDLDIEIHYDRSFWTVTQLTNWGDGSDLLPDNSRWNCFQAIAQLLLAMRMPMDEWSPEKPSPGLPTST